MPGAPLPPLRWFDAADVVAAMPPLEERLRLAEVTMTAFARPGAAELPPKIAIHPRPADAFVHAMHITTLVAAGIMVVAAGIVLSWIPRKSALPTGGAPTGAPKSAESVAA